MPDIAQPQLENRILSRLAGEDFDLLARSFVPMHFTHDMVISEPNQRIPYILFPEVGLVSIVVQTEGGEIAESGLVGREGFVTTAIMLGTDRVPNRVDIQMDGHGHRIDVADFLAAVDQSDTLRDTLLRFTQCLAVQTTYTAMSNASHTVDERLARWLLMCHDRSASDDLYLTHKFMAVMLAVRRASVTTALQALEGKRLVRAERGYVMILNRAGLEAFAGDAYGRPEAEYRRLLGPL